MFDFIYAWQLRQDSTNSTQPFIQMKMTNLSWNSINIISILKNAVWIKLIRHDFQDNLQVVSVTNTSEFIGSIFNRAHFDSWDNRLAPDEKRE